MSEPASDSNGDEQKQFAQDYHVDFKYFPIWLNTTRSIRGSRFHYQLCEDENLIYHSKLKNMNQNTPFPISEGGEAHYSDQKTYFMTPSDDFHHFELTKDGVKWMDIVFTPNSEDSTAPKTIQVVWTPPNGPEIRLKNRMPTRQEDGKWILDLFGRYSEASNKIAVMIDESNDDVLFMIRDTEYWVMSIDAREHCPRLLPFALLMALSVCPF